MRWTLRVLLAVLVIGNHDAAGRSRGSLTGYPDIFTNTVHVHKSIIF